MNIEATKLELIKLIADEQSVRLLEQVRLFFKKTAKPKARTKNGKAKPDSGIVKEADKPPLPNIEPELKKDKLTSPSELLQIAKQPTPATIDIEQLKKEQGYDPNKLWELMKDWDYSLFEDQSLKELLDTLTP